MMTDHDSFIRAICEEPDCDVRRLVFADFLDENGQPERATFIRNQIELYGKTVVWEVPRDLDRDILPVRFTEYSMRIQPGEIPHLSPYDRICFASEKANGVGRPVGAVKIGGNAEKTEIEFGPPQLLPPNVIDAWRAQELREECGRLYRVNYQSWFPDVSGGSQYGRSLQPSWVDGRVTRGFIGHLVQMDHNLFMRVARAGLFRSHPISQVYFTGLYALYAEERGGLFIWWNPSRSRRGRNRTVTWHYEPPQKLYDLMEPDPDEPGQTEDKSQRLLYFTEAKAVIALSRAAVIYGRRKAGLPVEFARAPQPSLP